MGDQKFGIEQQSCQKIARAIRALRRANIDVAIVIGGGNIFRGIHLEELGLQRTPADQMGMLSTMINGIALQQALLSIDCPAKVMSALDCPKAVESFTQRSAQEALDQGHVLIFVGGTGNSYFTTDTAAALRASEIQADALIKATKVDGIYDRDPLKFDNAKLYKTLTYSEILTEDLKVMDATSIALCRNNHIPIWVFNMNLLEEDQILGVFNEKKVGTLVKGEK